MMERNKLVLRGDKSHGKMCAFWLGANETHLDTIVDSRGMEKKMNLVRKGNERILKGGRELMKLFGSA